MRRIHPSTPEPLHSVAGTRRIEQRAQAVLPPHDLMARAGLALARLALALAPHARTIWIACGPGNNGGDGLVAATHLHKSGRGLQVVVTLCADPEHIPPDAAHAFRQAKAAGVPMQASAPDTFDLAIDALLGIGKLRTPEGPLAGLLNVLQAVPVPVLCVDLPSGLDADSGRYWSAPRTTALPGERHTLALLTLKPGLFTADGRDQAGTVWLDELGVVPDASVLPVAWLAGAAPQDSAQPHATHKGRRGDVIVIGGQDIAVHGAGMTGAAVLAARAALHAGAGRVYCSLLEGIDTLAVTGWDPVCPELMFRRWSTLQHDGLLDHATVVCGCGGGEAVAEVLPAVLEQAPRLVLDADGLNVIAAAPSLQALLRQRRGRGQLTVLTPHPLEAARLLGTSTDAVMADRLGAAQQICTRYGALCVLKGSGTVICAPEHTPLINPSGNAALATAGTGDVLAGLLGCVLAGSDPGTPVLTTVARGVFLHGWMADQWVATGLPRLTADGLARGLQGR